MRPVADRENTDTAPTDPVATERQALPRPQERNLKIEVSAMGVAAASQRDLMAMRAMPGTGMLRQ